VDLGPYLDGTRPAAVGPSVGAVRSDGQQFLYPGRWHTCIGLTGCGKSWLAIECVRAELLVGNHVAYVHFEEDDPAPTLERLSAIGVGADLIRKALYWLDPDARGRYGALMAGLDPAPTLVVLDGINAACGSESSWLAETVTKYRKIYVAPATSRGAAVLSLGHPPKDPSRQMERHGYGSSAWLDMIDGTGMRAEAGSPPIRRGGRGTMRLYSVKDRAGQVERSGRVSGDRVYLGQLSVDDTGTDFGAAGPGTAVVVLAPSLAEAADPVVVLAEQIVECLRDHDGAYGSATELRGWLGKALGDVNKLAPAIAYLEEQGQLVTDPYRKGHAKGGHLVEEDDQHGVA
jgi:hypothetical protein